MTNYNERLDEAIKGAVTPAWLQQVHKTTDVPAYQLHLNETKQAITSLIKELVAEAKPEVKAHPLGPVTLADCQRGLDHYEANLLKALEEL